MRRWLALMCISRFWGCSLVENPTSLGRADEGAEASTLASASSGGSSDGKTAGPSVGSGGTGAGGQGNGGGAGGEQPVRCLPAATLKPLSAFDASPASMGNEACGVDNALELDDKLAGLERFGSSEAGFLDGTLVGACLGVDFGAPLPLMSVGVRASPVSNACGAGVCISECDTKLNTFMAFAGPTLAEIALVDAAVYFTTKSLEDFILPLPVTLEVRYVVVCRDLWGADTNDVGVDAIWAICP